MKELGAWVGKRLVLQGDHPHAGTTGVGVCLENTITGTGLRVKLERGLEPGCFVFDTIHVREERRT